MCVHRIDLIKMVNVAKREQKFRILIEFNEMQRERELIRDVQHWKNVKIINEIEAETIIKLSAIISSVKLHSVLFL